MKAKLAKSNYVTRFPDWPLRLKSVLVPLDFSAESKQALAYAIQFARKFGAKLTLLHVIEPLVSPDFVKSYPLAVDDDQVADSAKNELARWVKLARIPRGVVEKILVRFGRSFHEIVEAARTRKVDLIIIATHSHTGLKHVLLGSTTERVVRHAPCPVLVVRPGE